MLVNQAFYFLLLCPLWGLLRLEGLHFSQITKTPPPHLLRITINVSLSFQGQSQISRDSPLPQHLL